MRHIALALCTWVTAGPVSGMEVSLGVGARAETGRFVLSHDASRAFAVLGSPTSILDHDGLMALTTQIAIEGRDEAVGPWFDVMVQVPLGGQGRFRDTDYFAGQVLFSDTISDSRWWRGGVMGRIAMPDVDPGHWSGWTVRPYVTGSAELGHFSARGLDCGTICGSLPRLAPETEVIGQGLAALSGGAGAWLSRSVGESGWIDVRADVSAGYLGVRDSHHFRPDLGPVPNIAFDFATVAIAGEIGYSHRLDGGAMVTGSVFGGFEHGRGQAVFGAGLDPQLGVYPAQMTSASVGVALGLSVPF